MHRPDALSIRGDDGLSFRRLRGRALRPLGSTSLPASRQPRPVSPGRIRAPRTGTPVLSIWSSVPVALPRGVGPRRAIPKQHLIAVSMPGLLASAGRVKAADSEQGWSMMTTRPKLILSVLLALIVG